jgi:hypothetical protein
VCLGRTVAIAPVIEPEALFEQHPAAGCMRQTGQTAFRVPGIGAARAIRPGLFCQAAGWRGFSREAACQVRL